MKLISQNAAKGVVVFKWHEMKLFRICQSMAKSCDKVLYQIFQLLLFCDHERRYKGALSGEWKFQFLATERLLKRIKKAFYLNLKAFFLLEIFNFCLDFLVMQRNGLIKKIRLFFKLMTSQPGKKTIAIHITGIHILPNISRSKAIRQGNLVS